MFFILDFCIFNIKLANRALIKGHEKMIKKHTVYDGQYATSNLVNAHNKIVLNCIGDNDIYCINKICDTNVKTSDNCGIIAGLGNNKEIRFLVQVDLDKNTQRATVNITSLTQALSAPKLNQAIFLNHFPSKKVYSLEVTYNFGLKIEKELNQRHQEYYQSELKKNQHKVVSIAKQNNGKLY